MTLEKFLTEAEAACNKATPRPWEYWDNRGRRYENCYGADGTGGHVRYGSVAEFNQGVLIDGRNGSLGRPPDNEFVALARTALPLALKMIREVLNDDYGSTTNSLIEWKMAGVLDAGEK